MRKKLISKNKVRKKERKSEREKMNKVLGRFLVAIFSIVYTQLVNGQSLRGCQNKCGNLSIEYPFGISTGCYYAEQNNFNLTCNETTNELFAGGLPVINISHNGELRILKSGWGNFLQHNSE